MIDIKSLKLYLEHYFLTSQQFAKAANISTAQFECLIAAKAVPGPIYKLWTNGSVWSPIGAQRGNPDTATPESTWFTAAALWPARQAKILMENQNLSPESITIIFKKEFAREFRAALLDQEAHLYDDDYSALFKNQILVEAKLDTQTQQEWNSWIGGGYAVCLRRWDGMHLVVKNTQIARIRALTDEGTKPQLNPQELKELIGAIKRLDEVMLPFAPYQRSAGSPGKWIDQILDKYHLGHIPQSFSSPTQTNAEHLRLCC